MSGWLIYGAWLGVASVPTGLALVWDKRQARRGAWRVRERTLHLMELLGGWPGSFGVRWLVRHKTSKASYVWTARGIALLHLAGVVALLVATWD